MKTIEINNLGFRVGPSVKDADISIQVSDEVYKKISFWPTGKLWQYKPELNDFILVNSPYISELRFARSQECFPIINRGSLWYTQLSEEQKIELQEWYKAWLDVTETQQIPEKPEWL